MLLKQPHQTLRIQHFLLILSSLVFIFCLYCGYTFDDVVQIRDNEKITFFREAFSYFWTPVFPGDLYRPLTMLTYWGTYSLFGSTPFWPHFLNLCLYITVVILLFELLKEVFDETLGFYASLLFALNPIHAEVVCGVVGRSELLASAFLLTSLLCIKKTDPQSIAKILLPGSLFLAALLSKESSVCALCLVPLLFINEDTGFAKGKMMFARAGKWLAILLAVFFLYLTLRFEALGSNLFSASNVFFPDNPLIALSLPERVIKAISLLGRYVALSIFPYRLSADYSFNEISSYFSLSSLDSFFFAVFILFIGSIFSLPKPKQRICMFYIGWFIGSFAVTSNVLFPIGTIFAERLAFLPSVGPMVLLSMLFISIPDDSLRRLLFGSLLFLFGAKSMAQSTVWKDDWTLWEYQARTSTESAKTLQNAASQLKIRGQFEDALFYNGKALSIYPQFPEAALLRGMLFGMKNDFSQAETWFKRSHAIAPDYVPALTNLGILNLNRNMPNEAREQFNEALKIDPGNFDALFGLAATMLRLGEEATAKDILERLMARRSDDARVKELYRHVS